MARKRETCNFDEALQDKWGSAETAMGVCDCGRTTGTGTGVLWVRIQAYVLV